MNERENNMGSEQVVTGYPVLDWATLQKGTVLDVVACSTAMGVSASRWRGDRLLALKLCAAIRDHRPDLEAHVRCSGDTIQILDDAGAEEYTWRLVRGHVRGIASQGARRGAIDHRRLGDGQRRTAEARDGAIGRAAIAARRELHCAALPGLPPAPDKNSPDEPKCDEGGK